MLPTTTNLIKPNEDKQPLMENLTADRKVYRKPMLEELGDLRTLTLGTSPGNGDSLDPFNFQGV